jgi:hypothetical protein
MNESIIYADGKFRVPRAKLVEIVTDEAKP